MFFPLCRTEDGTLTLDKETTETILSDLLEAENLFAKDTNLQAGSLGMCFALSNTSEPKDYYFFHNARGQYLQSWYHDDGIPRSYAYMFRPDIQISREEECFARLVWLDFMILELLDHLETFPE